MKTNVEAEGKELILRNEDGHIAIIPAYLAKKVGGFLDADDQDSINQIINTLPLAEDYAEDGSLYIGSPIKAANGVVVEGDPLIDPTKPVSPSDQLMQSLKKKPESYTPQQPKKGLTDYLFPPGYVAKEVVRRLKDNLNPSDYAGLPGRIKSAVFDNEVDPERKRREELPQLKEGEEPDEDRLRVDVMHLYNKEPQKFNTLYESPYRPTIAKNKDQKYWAMNDPAYNRGVISEIGELKRRKGLIEENLSELNLSEDDAEKLFNAAYVVDRRIPREEEGFLDVLSKVPGIPDFLDYDKSISKSKYEDAEKTLKSYLPKLSKVSGIYEKQEPLEVVARELSRYNRKNKGITPDTKNAIMQNHFLTFGKDKKGEYVSYSEDWDINPFPDLEEAGIDTNFGTPVPLYGRIYYKQNESGEYEEVK